MIFSAPQRIIGHTAPLSLSSYIKQIMCTASDDWSLTCFVVGSGNNCLTNVPAGASLTAMYPGRTYSADQQCNMTYGGDAVLCRVRSYAEGCWEITNRKNGRKRIKFNRRFTLLYMCTCICWVKRRFNTSVFLQLQLVIWLSTVLRTNSWV